MVTSNWGCPAASIPPSPSSSAQRAYGSRLRATCVDTGFLRQGELAEVRQVFGDAGISYLAAADDFLPDVETLPYTGPDPQGEARYYDQVRRTIGARFIDTFVRHARSQGRQPVALVQGTNYADIIESITNLKAHHNVGGLPAQLDVRVIEPIAGLFKFEIRQLAAHLGLPAEVVHRQPSPGPGLAIRMWGPVTRAKVDALRRGTRIFEELVRRHYPEPPQRPTQYYLALAPLASCGLMGDDRVYGYAWVNSRRHHARPRELRHRQRLRLLAGFPAGSGAAPDQRNRHGRRHPLRARLRRGDRQAAFHHGTTLKPVMSFEFLVFSLATQN